MCLQPFVSIVISWLSVACSMTYGPWMSGRSRIVASVSSRSQSQSRCTVVSLSPVQFSTQLLSRSSSVARSQSRVSSGGSGITHSVMLHPRSLFQWKLGSAIVGSPAFLFMTLVISRPKAKSLHVRYVCCPAAGGPPARCLSLCLSARSVRLAPAVYGRLCTALVSSASQQVTVCPATCSRPPSDCHLLAIACSVRGRLRSHELSYFSVLGLRTCTY